MQSLVTLIVAGIALFALGCLVFGLLVVGLVWTARQTVRAIARITSQANQQARSCYNEPLQSMSRDALKPIVEVRGEA